MWAIAVGLVLSLTVATKNNDDSYPIYTVSGTHYQVGNQTGTLAKDRIQAFVNNPNGDLSWLRKCNKIDTCAANLQNMTQYNEKEFPFYFEEMQGIADGANIDFSDVLLLAFATEIEIMINS